MAAPSTLTSNQYYRGLNRKFDKRAKLLKRLGFKYESVVDAVGIAYFKKPGRLRQGAAIPAAVLSHADNRHFYECVRRAM